MEKILIGRYLLVSCCDEGISNLGSFDTLKKAQEEMKNNFLECTNYSLEEPNDDYAFEDDSAWAHTRHVGTIDWRIIDLQENA